MSNRQAYDPELAGADCKRCPLRGSEVVPPNGNAYADMVFVAEGPAQHEIAQKKLVVGPAGLQFNEILKTVGLDRSKVWITAAMLCRAETPGLEGKRRYDMKTYFAWLRKQNAERKKLATTYRKEKLAEWRAWRKATVEGLIAAGQKEEAKAVPKLPAVHEIPVPEELQPIPTPLECCANRLWNELQWFEQKARESGRPNGVVVVPMGNFALQAVAGRQGVMKARGSVMPIDPDKREAIGEQLETESGDDRPGGERTNGSGPRETGYLDANVASGDQGSDSGPGFDSPEFE